jgi:hypothetical protein
VQIDQVANLVVLQGLLNLVQQIVTAQIKLNRIVEFVKYFALGVFEYPGQGDNAVICDVHGAELSQFGETDEKTRFAVRAG